MPNNGFFHGPGGGTTDYNDLENKPELFSGSYNDLTDKPTENEYTATLSASDWSSDDIPVITIRNSAILSSEDKIFVSESDEITPEQIQALGKAVPGSGPSGNGYFQIRCLGIKPEIDIPIKYEVRRGF